MTFHHMTTVNVSPDSMFETSPASLVGETLWQTLIWDQILNPLPSGRSEAESVGGFQRASEERSSLWGCSSGVHEAERWPTSVFYRGLSLEDFPRARHTGLASSLQPGSSPERPRSGLEAELCHHRVGPLMWLQKVYVAGSSEAWTILQDDTASEVGPAHLCSPTKAAHWFMNWAASFQFSAPNENSRWWREIVFYRSEGPLGTARYVQRDKLVLKGRKNVLLCPIMWSRSRTVLRPRFPDQATEHFREVISDLKAVTEM